MNRNIFLRGIVIVLALLSLAACDDEALLTSVGGEGTSLTVVASLPKPVATRAVTAETEDMWSYTGFTVGDKLGFYSEHGNWNVDEGLGSFANMPMTCESGGSPYKFNNDEMTFSPTHMQATAVYMYYPYTPDMLSEGSSENAPGLELRRLEGDTLRCVDFLTTGKIDATQLGNGLLAGSFEHAFSELIIMRGKGFDHPPVGKERITVVVRNGYSHLKINLGESPWSCTPELVLDPDYDRVADCRQWDAWQGGNFQITREDTIGRPAWYVVLPTWGRGNGRNTVEYIEICDNDGAFQRVSSLKLSGGNTKLLDAGTRYPLEVTMEELVPTVNPFNIIPWNSDEDLTYARTRGITNVTDFNQWLEAYNAYLRDGDRTDDLLQYGDRIIDEATGSISWHFYIMNDIDFALETDEQSAPFIPDLRDILDGVSTTLDNHTFRNHALLNLKRPLVGTLSGNGTLQNLDFRNSYVNSKSTEPVGTLANTMTGGTIENCTMNLLSTVISNGPAGMAVGQMTGGTVRGCTFSGTVIGSTSAASTGYITGNEPDAACILEDNTSDVIFSDSKD